MSRNFRFIGALRRSLALALALSVMAAPPALAQGKPGENKGSGTSSAPRGPAPSQPLIDFARRWDVNHDEVFACTEFRQFMIRVFMRSDANRDGALAGVEFETVKGADPVFAEAAFGYFDADNDGRISQAELVDHPNPLFTLYDRNRDCEVTAAELAPAGTGEASRHK